MCAIMCSAFVQFVVFDILRRGFATRISGSNLFLDYSQRGCIEQFPATDLFESLEPLHAFYFAPFTVDPYIGFVIGFTEEHRQPINSFTYFGTTANHGQ